MRVPLSWLRDFVDWPMADQDLADRLTMAGLEVAAIESIGADWGECFIGKVVSVGRHPNADRLSLCTVDIGTTQVQVVCGAPNVAAGQTIAFANPGSLLVNAKDGTKHTLQSAVIRGIRSEGMICSEKELGLGEDHDGILVLDDALAAGTPLAAVLGDTILDIETTANRPDALSLLGIAYEVAAISDSDVRFPELQYDPGPDSIKDSVSVEVPDPALCPRYVATMIQNLEVAPSPGWMQDRLRKAGFRPINNIVDITNYVMLELGQPLHAFDSQRLDSGAIIVRSAHAGETIKTLDEITRKLDPHTLVIANGDTPIAIAGIIGGAETEVISTSKSILLESASFHPFNTRASSGRLRLRTEASLRFEKGLRPDLPLMGLHRATRLLSEIAGGIPAREVIDVYPQKPTPPTPSLTKSRLQGTLGFTISLNEAKVALSRLGFSSTQDKTEKLQVTVPPWRSDISLEDDLIEEVARVIGYDRIPTHPLSHPIPSYVPNPMRMLKKTITESLVRSAFQEVVTYPLISASDLAKVSEDPKSSLAIANPLSPEHQFLRTTLVPSILNTLSPNVRRERGPIRLCEVSRVYLPRDNQLPDERETLVAVLTGPHEPPSWRNQPRILDFFDAKGIADTLFATLAVEVEYQSVEHPLLENSKGVQIIIAGAVAGFIGEINTAVLQSFDIDVQSVALLQLDLSCLVTPFGKHTKTFTPLPKYPEAIRDIALVADTTIPAVSIQALIESHPLVAEALLFDIYTGDQVPAGKRSLNYSIILRSENKTLDTKEIQQAMHAVLNQLESELKVTLRQGL